ncbi:MAG: ABC transporter ATP-binding protein [Proteobacteria bacterium]|nr:ABC transporter ATP-binding protein [Pseudomonadota bacterium]
MPRGRGGVLPPDAAASRGNEGHEPQGPSHVVPGTKIDIREVGVAFASRLVNHPVVALEDVSLGIEEGEFVCLLGPSGCGKTTLLNAIAGFIEPTGGQIRVAGRAVDGPGPDRGMVFQEYGLFPWFTVEQNIQYGPRLKGLPKDEISRISRHYVELVHLAGFEHHYPNELSGGMKQRVGIARALANQPEILLMDEPFGALDAQTRERMQDELLRLWEAERRTCVFVTHSIAEAIFLADRVILLTARPGRIKRDIRVAIARPRDRTSEAFFALYREVNTLLREEIQRASEEGDERVVGD